jgi:hypothetical protein
MRCRPGEYVVGSAEERPVEVEADAEAQVASGGVPSAAATA